MMVLPTGLEPVTSARPRIAWRSFSELREPDDPDGPVRNRARVPRHPSHAGATRYGEPPVTPTAQKSAPEAVSISSDLVGAEGIEPSATAVSRQCSTAELHTH